MILGLVSTKIKESLTLVFQVFMKFKKKLKSTDTSLKHFLLLLKVSWCFRKSQWQGLAFIHLEVPLSKNSAVLVGFPPKWYCAFFFFFFLFSLPTDWYKHLYKQFRKLHWKEAECFTHIKTSEQYPDAGPSPVTSSQWKGGHGFLSFSLLILSLSWHEEISRGLL